jgi:lysosomal acid lipase/cholesteryl ester hydrolase
MKKIIYVGHSQGSTQFLLALGVHEELKEKIAGFVGMGSIVSLRSLVDNVAMNFLSRMYIFELLQLLGFSKVLLISRWMSQAIGVLLYNSAFHTRLITRGMQHLIGRNNDLIPPSMVGLIFTHEPGGASLNNLLHWMQCFRSRKTFSKFCFGRRRNLQVYGMEQPPEYCLQHLKTLPFASLLFRGEKDGLASHEDFMELVGRFDEESVSSVELKEYNHLDYLWSEKAPLDIYQRILAFSNENSTHQLTV